VDPSLRTAATGMVAQQTRIDVIANIASLDPVMGEVDR
jgi:flagellar basal body rod protein FlgG